MDVLWGYLLLRHNFFVADYFFYLLSLSLTCFVVKYRGQQLLEWDTPFNRSHVDGRLSLVDCSGAGLFCSTLIVTAATANETGLYRCSFQNQPVEAGKTSASVYVFVQGEHPPHPPLYMCLSKVSIPPLNSCK